MAVPCPPCGGVGGSCETDTDRAAARWRLPSCVPHWASIPIHSRWRSRYVICERCPLFNTITLTASSGSYELLKEQDPLDLLAIVGQLGGVFSFIALGFGAVFVRINPEVEERRAHSMLARCVGPTDELSDDHAAPEPSAELSPDVKI